MNPKSDVDVSISAYIGKWFVREDLASGTLEIIGKGYLHEAHIPGVRGSLKLPLLAPPLTLAISPRKNGEKISGSLSAYDAGSRDYHIDIFAAVDPDQAKHLKDDILSNRKLPQMVRIPASIALQATDSGTFEPAHEKLSGTISGMGWIRPCRRDGEPIRYSAFVEDLIGLRAQTDPDHESWFLSLNQFQRIVSQLVISAIDKALLEGTEIADARSTAFGVAYDVISLLLNVERGTRKVKREAGVDVSDRGLGNIEWHKRDPQQDYRRGKKSLSWRAISQDDIDYVTEMYIASGLRSSVVEHILVDAMIYCETRAFGESVAVQAPGIRRDWLGISREYSEAHGDLDEIATKNRWRSLPKIIIGFLLWFVVPILAALVAAAQHGFSGLTYIAGLWIGAVFLLPKLRTSLGIGEGKKIEMEAHAKRIDVLQAMIRAYKDIEPGVHPSRVLRSLDRAADLGAVWNSHAIALLVRADRQDSNTPDVERHGDQAIGSCMRAVRNFYDNLVKSGAKIQMPDFEAER